MAEIEFERALFTVLISVGLFDGWMLYVMRDLVGFLLH